jgi:arginyl-tRNA synthetase
MKVGREKISGKYFQKSEGAIVYVPDESRNDINTSVFINSEGNPTYLAKDIGLIKIKKEKFNFDKSYYVVDNEQIAHFRTVFAVAEEIFPEVKNKNIHLPHGRMTFKGQKMSSRLGGVPSGEEVIDTILEAVKEKSGERNISEEVMREIALSALRISILRAKPGVNIDFDPEKALSFEGDSGPYLCYTSARLHSLLQKGKENNLFPGCQLAHDGAERKLERKIFQFDRVLENVVEEIAPQKLVTYMFELTGEFNNFYAHTKIISENKQDKFESEHYLYVVQKTLNVLTKGLYILGINAPERM